MYIKLRDWKIENENLGLNANVVVPNDITDILNKNNYIEEPYFGLNHNSLKKYLDEDYTFVNNFIFSERELLENNELFLAFNGIDFLSDIYLNGVFLGKTDNMFKKYVYDITDKVLDGKNELKVILHSTTKYMESLDCKDYFGVFNIPRLLIRKEQCCFGWDWAPNIPGYGIWQDVELYSEYKHKLVDVHYSADMNGNAIFYMETNYSTKDGWDNEGNFIVNPNKFDDYIRVSLTKNPNNDFNDVYVKQVKVEGYKSFIAFTNDNPSLWWPIGYGEHPLYSYKVELIREGKVISEKHGKFGYRSVSICEKIVDENTLGHSIVINGKTVYVKGANWVPIDCFTGCIDDSKYDKLTDMAANGNFNMLRVWGGGIYEKDIFYALCDQKGIMVWQDLMFACADLPENNEAWVKNTCEEIEYQVKRLRNYTSLVYWCGGNEKTGSFGALMSYGDNFTNYTLRGIVTHLDETRPFVRQSPFSKTDSANDINSGESHYNSFESLIVYGVDSYRDTVAKNIVPFISEGATQGPQSEQAFNRIFPKDKLWPMNEYWEDRLMDNPYAAYKMRFSQRQLKIATDFYGAPNSLKEFVAKGMLVHSETMRCEIEYQRANKGKTFGFMNWMFSEMYPSATWAIIDYYLEPKQVYYQMKQSYRPVLMSFYKAKDGYTYLFGTNDTLADKKINFTYGLKNLSGDILWKKEGNTILDTEKAFYEKINEDFSKDNAYLFVNYSFDGIEERSLYSDTFWRNCNFNSDYIAKVNSINDNTVEIIVEAKSFVKALFVSCENNYKCDYSDNYIDIEAGEKAKIIISSEEKININKIELRDFAQSAVGGSK